MADKITIYDIAREAGVSIATVSRVMAGKGNVRAETAQRTLKVIEKYHFRPSAPSRGAYQRRSGVIGMLLSDPADPFFSLVYQGAEDEARHSGYVLQLLGRPPMEDKRLEIMLEQRPDGLILGGEGMSQSLSEGMEAALLGLSDAMPAVLCAAMPPRPGFMNVTIDLAGAVEQAVNHLISLGHRHLMLLGGGAETGNPVSRASGFFDAMRRQGPGVLAAHIREEMTPAGGVRALERALCSAYDKPTAVICAGDQTALGVYKAAAEKGPLVPGDLSVVSLGNTALCPYLHPALTSVEAGALEAGRQAVLMLRQALQGHRPADVLLPCALARRDSCAPPREREENERSL